MTDAKLFLHYVENIIKKNGITRSVVRLNKKNVQYAGRYFCRKREALNIVQRDVSIKDLRT